MKFPNVRIDKREKMIMTMFKKTKFIHVLEKNDGEHQYITDGCIGLKLYDRHDIKNTKSYDEDEFDAIKNIFDDENQEDFGKIDSDIFESVCIDVDQIQSHNSYFVKSICKIIGGEVKFYYIEMPGCRGFKILKIVGANGVGILCPVRK